MPTSFKHAKNQAIKVAKKHEWPIEFKRSETLHDGSWVFWCVDPLAPWEDEREAVVVHKDNDFPIAVYGAIGREYFSPGKLRALGHPKSAERWIGSGPGRYQLFEKGIVVWDAITRDARSRITYDKNYAKGKPSLGYVIFFDLRGFTDWTKNHQPDIQGVLENFEDVVQKEFPPLLDRSKSVLENKTFIFMKGVGDGVMLILEESQGEEPGRNEKNRAKFSARKLLQICAKIIIAAGKRLPPELRIGCGIDYGEITRVFLFGQWDYVGDQVNQASKLQSKASNSIIVSNTFQKKMVTEDSAFTAKGIKFFSEKNPPLTGVQYQPKDIAPQ